MSKICDRNYGDGTSMLSVKMIDGIGCCPSCEQPAICHQKSVEYRALFWAVHYDTGMSSKSIAQHFATGISDGQPPSDASDRNRCIKLLYLVPEWLPRLDEMRKYDQQEKKQETFVMNSSGISAYDNSWAKQIPLMVQEGKL